MSYEVIITPLANDDIQEQFECIYGYSTSSAETWTHQFYQTLRQLRLRPSQYGLAPESSEVSDSLRHVFFEIRKGRRYRILYVIR